MGADVNIADFNDVTPLMMACVNKDVKIVKMFIKESVHLDVKDKNGWTALHYAGNTLTVTYKKTLILLSFLLHPHPLLHHTHTINYTDTLPPAYGGSYDVCMALLVNNVNYGAVDKNQRSATDIAKYKGDTTHTHDNTLVPLPPNH